MYKHVIVLVFVQVSVMQSAPLQFPLLQPMDGTLQQQRLALQEQMFAIQQFQALQRFNAVPPPVAMNPLQPLLLLIPNSLPNMEPTKTNEDLHNSNKALQDLDDDDSIAIESEPQNEVKDEQNAKTNPMKAILLIPNNARFSLGDFITSIPFLPFEVNVPDSISWIYNGIAGVISGIGQNWPFNRPQGNENSEMKVKSPWSDFKVRPIIVMPLGQPMIPMQL